jgi:hypothetical protein
MKTLFGIYVTNGFPYENTVHGGALNTHLHCSVSKQTDGFKTAKMKAHIQCNPKTHPPSLLSFTIILQPNLGHPCVYIPTGDIYFHNSNTVHRSMTYLLYPVAYITSLINEYLLQNLF